MSKVNIVFFNVPKNLPMIGELMRYYQGQDDFETADVSNPSEVSQLLSMSGNGVIIFKVENKPDLQAVVTLLKSQKKLLRKGLVKTACLSFVKSKKVEKILAKYGCQEVLNPRNITSKTFSFKINFWSKNIRAQLVREEKDAAFQQKSNNANAKDTGTTGGKKEDFKHCEALTLPSDIWISKLKIDHKRILKRYLSRLMGPSPHMGKWMELEPQPGDRLPTWKFVLKDPEGQLIMEDGAWYFSGSRPEFDWKINRWNFSSERPHLYFYTKDGNVHSRLKYENGQVLITENSSYALTKEQYILQTCESTFAFDNENEEAEQGENLEGDSADAVSGHYEGESKTDHLDNKLEGKSSTDQLEGDRQKGSNGYQEGDVGGNLEGKNQTDEINGDPLSGNINHGAMIENGEKKKSGYQEAQIDGTLSGQSSTDQIQQDPLSGDISGGEKKSQQDKESNFEEEAIDTHYEGNNSFEEVERGPLSGYFGKSRKKKQTNSDSDFDEEKIEKHYNGRGSVDEVEREPLSGELNPGESLDQKDEYSEESTTPLKHGDIKGSSVDENPDSKSSMDELDRDAPNMDLGSVPKKQSRSQSESSEGHEALLDEKSNHHGGHFPGEEFETMHKKSSNIGSSKEQELEEFEDIEELEREPIQSEFEEKSNNSIESLDKINPGLVAERDERGKKADHSTGSAKREDHKNREEGLNIDPKNSDSNDEIEELERDTNLDFLPSGRKLEEEAPLATGTSERSNPRDERDLKEEEIEQALGGGTLLDAEELKNKVVEAKPSVDLETPNLDKVIGQDVSTESGEVKVIVSCEIDGQSINQLCEFEEFFPDELVVSGPQGRFKTSQKVRALIRLTYSGEKLVIEARGVVSDVEELGEELESAAISIDAIDENIYNQFMGLYQQRQENIHQFMKQAKGQD